MEYTAGLNKIRTSPDHGTAFDIAGKELLISIHLKRLFI
jgi:4-hydroxythreonine-4-phosphate dehydrogenase